MIQASNDTMYHIRILNHNIIPAYSLGVPVVCPYCAIHRTCVCRGARGTMGSMYDW
jgi:hypothetical protein